MHSISLQENSSPTTPSKEDQPLSNLIASITETYSPTDALQILNML